MGEPFAKIFDTTKGQVLALADEGDNGPELRWYARPPGLGVCQFAIGFKDDNDGWAALDKAFDAADMAQAEMAAQILFKATGA